jgi:helix-turn-helix protein
MTSHSAPPSNSPSQRERILSLLRSRGSSGATNLELNAICFRYGARIFELRKAGFDIKTRREGETEFRFVLVGEPENPKSLPTFEQRRRREEAGAMPLFAGGAA